MINECLSFVDEKTEVLTSNGWVFLPEYRGERILQYDLMTDSGYFAFPNKFLVEPCNYFFHFKNSKGLDQMLSIDSHVSIFSGNGNNINELKFSKKLVSSFTLLKRGGLSSGYYKFKTCFSISSPGIILSDELIRICIMIQADGHISSQKNHNRVALHLKRERKVNRAKELLERANIDFRVANYKDGSVNITFNIPKTITKSLSMFFNANYEQLKIISDECLLWDGYKGYRSHYSTVDQGSADLIQLSFLGTNTRASIYLAEDKKHTNRRKWYNVIPTRNPFVGYNVYPEKVQLTNGTKYGFSTSTGNVLFRRNFYTFIA